MKRTIENVLYIDNIPLDKKVKLFNRLELSLMKIFENDKKELEKENISLSYYGYLECLNYLLNYRNSNNFKNLNIDILLIISSFLSLKNNFTLLFICKNWFEKLYNCEYFWKELGYQFDIEYYDKVTIENLRNFILLKYKYYNYFKNEKRSYASTSLEGEEITSNEKYEIGISLIDDLYFKGDICFDSAVYRYKGETLFTWDCNINGVYFESITLQYFFFKLIIDTDCEAFNCNRGSLFKLYISNESFSYGNEGKCLVEIEHETETDYKTNLNLLQELLVNWLKLYTIDNNKEIERELTKFTWLKGFFNELPKEIEWNELFEAFPFPKKKLEEESDEESEEESSQEEEEDEE
ncbi:hypothetical protein ABK040_011214 [Willaertia magna]